MEISTSLASVLKTRPQIGPKEAIWVVRDQLLANNPYEPPSNGKCPINELPAEILGRIFEVGVEMEEEGEEEEGEEGDIWEDMSDEDGYIDDLDDLSAGSPGSSGSSDTSAPDGDVHLFQILVSHVCRHWRQVACNLPVLWTRLVFEDTLQLEKSKVFIDRAQGLPLNIYIDYFHPLDNQNEETRTEVEDHPKELESFLSQNGLMQILDLIEPEVSHWGELVFHVNAYRHVQTLLARLHKLPSAPLLKTFQVYHHEDCSDYETFQGDDKSIYLPFHGNVPLLESAVFWGVHIDWDNSLQFLHGLREFELSYHAKNVRPSYNTFIQIIKNSPELRSLSLSLSGPALATGAQFDDEGQWGPEPFEISSVHYLALEFHDPQHASALIQHFYFPNLRELTLNFDEEDYSSFVRTLLVPVKGRSKSILSGLEKLKILGLPCDMAAVEAMLQELTALKALYLKCFGSEELVIFKKLIDPLYGRKKQGDTQTVPQNLPKVFCPALEFLTIFLVRGSQLKALVMARKLAGVPLKSLMLSYDDGITKGTKEWLENHVEVIQFFEPSDSEEDVSVGSDMEADDGDDENDNEDNDEEDEDEDEDEDDIEDEDEDPPLGADGAPLPSSITRRRRLGRDLD